jgi:hypothetical protein
LFLNHLFLGAICNGGVTFQSLEGIFEDGLQETKAKDV